MRLASRHGLRGRRLPHNNSSGSTSTSSRRRRRSSSRRRRRRSSGSSSDPRNTSNRRIHTRTGRSSYISKFRMFIATSDNH